MSGVHLDNLTPDLQRKVELLATMDNYLGRVNYPFFVQRVLGLDFPEMRDPRVQRHLHRVGGTVNEWLANRDQQRVFKKVMDIRPRGTCKSSGVTVPLTPYVHLRDAELAAAIMSCRYEDMAVKFTSAVKQAWQGESQSSVLTQLYGDFTGRGDGRVWNTDRMTTSKRRDLEHTDPTLSAFSVTKGPTSGHFKLFILDDPITEEAMEADSQWLDKVWNAYTRLSAVIDRDGLFYLIMTRYHDADLVGRIVEEEIEPIVRERELPNAPSGKLPPDWNKEKGWIKYAHLAGWTVFYDEVYEDYDTPRQRPAYPEIWPEERIAETRTKGTRGELFFWTQLMNQPQKREDNPIKDYHIQRAWLDDFAQIPPQAMHNVVILCDFAFKDEEVYLRGKGDRNVAYVMCQYDGHVYLVDGISDDTLTMDQFGEQLIRLAYFVQNEMHARVHTVTFDQLRGHGSGSKATEKWLYQLFNRHPKLGIPRFLAIPRTKKKTAKMLETAWAWQEGYVHVLRGVPGTERLMYQMQNIGYTSKDDEADAVSDIFHEELYRSSSLKARERGDGDRRWTPRPAIHGDFDHKGRFRPAARTGGFSSLTTLSGRPGAGQNGGRRWR